MNAQDLRKANDVLIPWVAAVLDRRVPREGATLRPMTEAEGWLGSLETGEITPYASFSNQKPSATWLPDEATARSWRGLQGLSK